MKRRTLLSTGQIAEHCQVSYETVTNWIRSGKLVAHQTPGGHHRVRVGDFDRFLADHGMPSFQKQNRQRPGVLIVDDSVSTADMYAKILSSARRYDLSICYDGFEAGVKLATEQPDLILLDLLMPGIDGFKICTMVKENPEFSRTRILVITGAPKENLQRAMDCGADDWMVKPVGVYELLNKVELLLQGGRPDEEAASASA